MRRRSAWGMPGMGGGLFLVFPPALGVSGDGWFGVGFVSGEAHEAAGACGFGVVADDGVGVDEASECLGDAGDAAGLVCAGEGLSDAGVPFVGGESSSCGHLGLVLLGVVVPVALVVLVVVEDGLEHAGASPCGESLAVGAAEFEGAEIGRASCRERV